MAENNNKIIITAAIAGACIGGGIMHWLLRNNNNNNVTYNNNKKNKNSNSFSSPRSNGGDWITQEIKPPLPKVVVDLLNACSLCYLSTSYVQSHEVIVLSTRKDTLKLQNLLQSPQVAILVHDFPHLQNSKKENYGNTYSITLYGTTRVADGDEADFFRQKHLEHNPKSKVFIQGKNIAIVLVNVTSARICNAADKVETWSVDS